MPRVVRLRKGLLSAAMALLVIFFIARIYFMWLDNYYLTHPDIIEASAAGYAEEQPLDGILLWDEQLVFAPQSGVLTYPSPHPRLVAKGEIIAALDGTAVRALYPAYFFPALDGQEGNWVYSRLWPDFVPFPFFKPAVLLENGIQLRKGAPIGKLVTQPQNLRCIAYLDATPSLERSLGMNNPTVRVRLKPEGREFKAEVTAQKWSGRKIKVCINLPFFPPSLLKSRKFSASIVEARRSGVMIPESAVITKDGRNIVFMLHGNTVASEDVDGWPSGDGSFFVIKGLRPGMRIVMNAEKVYDNMTLMW